MKNKFEKYFYGDIVDVIEITETGAYNKQITRNVLASGIKADVQPLGGTLAAELYGFEKKCENRMYYSECPHIEVGRYILHNNILFRVEYVTERNFGCMALLKSVGEEKQSNE